MRDILQAISDYPWAFLSLVVSLWFLAPNWWFTGYVPPQGHHTALEIIGGAQPQPSEKP